jgi:hypothetical protein
MILRSRYHHELWSFQIDDWTERIWLFDNLRKLKCEYLDWFDDNQMYTPYRVFRTKCRALFLVSDQAYLLIPRLSIGRRSWDRPRARPLWSPVRRYRGDSGALRSRFDGLPLTGNSGSSGSSASAAGPREDNGFLVNYAIWWVTPGTKCLILWLSICWRSK